MPDKNTRTTVVITVDGAQAVAELAAIAERLGLSKAKTLRQIIAIGAEVYGDAEAAKFAKPADALAGYVRGRGGKVLPS